MPAAETKRKRKGMTVEARCDKCNIDFDVTFPKQSDGLKFSVDFAERHTHSEQEEHPNGSNG